MKKFILRVLVWLVFVAVIPIVTIIDKYDMVKNGTLKYTGWGIIVLAIITVVVMVMLGYYLKTMKWSMTKQVIAGVRNVIIPLGLLFIGAGLIASNIENIRYILIVSIISEAIAIPINPFPQWVYEKNITDIKEALK